MILKPQKDDIKAIGYYLGKVIIGLGFFMFVPIIIGIFFKEINPILDFILGILISFSLGSLLIISCRNDKDLTWMQGMIVVSLSWIVATILCAIPLYLSHHWVSFLDACFDAMSGLTTTGLAVVQNLDHISFSHNFWRHMLMFMGGQGIVVVVLTFLVKGVSGAFKMYVGEAREEKVLPNVISTARFIWLVSLVYFVLGSFSLGIVGFFEGIPFYKAMFHGACIFMAGFDTAGFAPQSQNILYYHSLPFEIVTITIMFLGAMNFNFHYAIWTGKKREVIKNIEIVTLSITIAITFLLVAYNLVKMGVYPDVLSLFRKGFFQLISGHTTTGYMTIYAQQFITEWGNLALFGVIMAMALGGSSCSTAGGIKALRVGVIFKALVQDIRKIILPESAVSEEKFHHIKDLVLEEAQVRSAALITVAYIGLYFLGAIVAMFFGYPFLNSLFESTSAAGNVGLSCGITQASMPALLKLVFIFQMWAGRLEFMSVFVLIGFFLAWIKGK